MLVSDSVPFTQNQLRPGTLYVDDGKQHPRKSPHKFLIIGRIQHENEVIIHFIRIRSHTEVDILKLGSIQLGETFLLHRYWVIE